MTHYSGYSNIIGTDTNGVFTIGGVSYDFVTLKDAFDYINLGAVTGDIVLQIIDNTTELNTAILNSSGGGINYTSVLIYPVVPGKTIGGNINGDLIQFNHSENVHIDGRVNLVGANNLTINQTHTGKNAIHYIGCTNTDVLHCTVNGNIVTE
jgi:hypothetical protein